MPRSFATDGMVISALKQLGRGCPAYWSYSARNPKVDSYTLFQYPAMMVPAMLHDLLTAFSSSDRTIHEVCDPFLGSGSVLTEAMLHGHAFRGTDVNPLALLIAKVKSGPLMTRALKSRIAVLRANLAATSRQAPNVDFPGIDKWFSKEVLSEISAIRHAIRGVDSLWCRRFFWVCLAETVRLSSNSRTSTFKLHIRSAEDLASRASLSPIRVFDAVLTRNLSRYHGLETALKARGLLRRGRYTNEIFLELTDCRSSATGTKSDFLITSPPYGDNTTTVPYGQHSYLPLQCIDLHDIDPAVDSDCLATTHAIDSRSLGGHRENALRDIEPLRATSVALDECLAQLRYSPPDRANRVASFSRDLDAAVGPIVSRLRHNAYMVWVVGNRRVGGVEVPTARILADFLSARGAVHITTLDRTIPSKRMALRNSITSTMSRERLLIFRKEASHRDN